MKIEKLPINRPSQHFCSSACRRQLRNTGCAGVSILKLNFWLIEGCAWNTFLLFHRPLRVARGFTSGALRAVSATTNLLVRMQASVKKHRSCWSFTSKPFV